MLGKLNKKIFSKIVVGMMFFGMIAGVFLFLNCHPAYADANNMLWNNQAGNFKSTSGLGSDDPRIIVARVIRIALGFLGIIAIGLVIYAGFLWMTSNGEENKISQAKKILTNAAIGLVIILMSFAIVSFILNKLLEVTTGTSTTSPTNPGVGLGAMGACTVSTVYPEPGQSDVPRNTSIFITFKEEVNPITICQDNVIVNGKCDPGEYVLPEAVRIYKTNDGDKCPFPCTGNVLDVEVSTIDNKTFVFTPVSYLGSPSENIWYTVHLTNDIQKLDGKGVFSTCRTDYFEWQFEVNNQLDLTPPQVLSGGVFPAPDNARDAVTGTGAVRAKGAVSVNSQPAVSTPSTYTSIVPGGGSSPATIILDSGNIQTGTLTVAVATDGITAQIQSSGSLLGSAVFSGQTVDFPGMLSLTVTGPYSAGNFWTINGITAAVTADTLTVGNITYTFVSGSPVINQIQRGASTAATANNIVSVLGANTLVDAAIGTGPTVVEVTAEAFGASGNSIVLATNNTAALGITAMSGGAESQKTVTVNGRRDKPRNAVIQVNFNEAINPITVSGKAGDVANYIRVINAELGAAPAGAACASNDDCLSFSCNASNICVNDYLAGKFTISNVYRTVEFLSDNECGVNGCGEKIYCLPENGHIGVELAAANLDGCTTCNARVPYTACFSGHCQDPNTNYFYPKAVTPLDGVIDAALNSLDGDRSGDAEGPAGFYNENNGTGSGDSFTWSFYVTDEIDLDPPVITSIVPNHNQTDVSLSDPIRSNFSKLMMSSSLGTGSILITNGNTTTEHKLLNLWNFNNQATGYYVKMENVDDVPVGGDGEADWSAALIQHSLLYDAASYRAQAGSGLKTIYQNCFKPSAGVSCGANQSNPSCCCMTPTAAGSCSAGPCP